MQFDQDFSEFADASVWSSWINVYADAPEEVLTHAWDKKEDSPRSRRLKSALASQLFALSLYQPQPSDEQSFDNQTSGPVFGPETLRAYLAAENEAVEIYCRDLLDESQAETSGVMFGPETLQSYLDAENEAVETYCQDLVTASSSSHEQMPSSRSILAIARRFEDMQAQRPATGSSNLVAVKAGPREWLVHE
eukprot:s326_g6.t1